MLKKVEAIVRRGALKKILKALEEIDYPGLTVYEVEGHGKQKGHTAIYRGKPSATEPGEWDLFHMWGEDALSFLEEPAELTPPTEPVVAWPFSQRVIAIDYTTLAGRPSIREKLDRFRPDTIIIDDLGDLMPAQKKRVRFHVGASVVVKPSYKPPRGKPSRPLAGLSGIIDSIDGMHITVRFPDDPPNVYRGISRRHLRLAPAGCEARLAASAH